MKEPFNSIGENTEAMKGKPPPNSFIQAALELDETFASVEQIAGSLERLELDSETALERAKVLLVRFSERSQSLGSVLTHFGREMEQRRSQVEAAVQAVNDKAPLVQERFRRTEEKMERFRALSLKVREVTDAVASLGPAQVASRLRELAEEAEGLREEAREARLKTLEKNAHNLGKSLGSIAGKLATGT
jgi:hypothetical protein